jgi:hypothetical protein
MAITNYDAMAALYNWLRDSTDAAPIRALVHGTTVNIYEAADLRQGSFASLVASRQTAAETGTKILAISVHDLGDALQDDTFVQKVGICLWDVANGQDALRSIREQIKYYMRKLDDKGLTLADVVTKDQALLTYEYGGRTGYRQSEYYRAEYDMLTYTAIVNWKD